MILKWSNWRNCMLRCEHFMTYRVQPYMQFRDQASGGERQVLIATSGKHKCCKRLSDLFVLYLNSSYRSPQNWRHHHHHPHCIHDLWHQKRIPFSSAEISHLLHAQKGWRTAWQPLHRQGRVPNRANQFVAKNGEWFLQRCPLRGRGFQSDHLGGGEEDTQTDRSMSLWSLFMAGTRSECSPAYPEEVFLCLQAGGLPFLPLPTPAQSCIWWDLMSQS